MKRRANSESASRQTKLARIGETVLCSVDLSSNPQGDSKFFLLPRELRDQIYADAFGTKTMYLTHDGFKFFAYDGRFERQDGYGIYRTPQGLPGWVRSCKQIAKESMEILAHTWMYQCVGISRLHSNRTSSCEMSNPLVFYTGSIRNIVAEPGMIPSYLMSGDVGVRRSSLGDDRSKRIQKILQRLQIKDATLNLRWIRWWHTSSDTETYYEGSKWLKNEPQVWIEDCNERWAGRFRKVNITLLLRSDPEAGDASTWLAELAEAHAKQLVGPNGTISWTKTCRRNNGWDEKWTWCVTVARKA
jgi:hypothetical protein